MLKIMKKMILEKGVLCLRVLYVLFKIENITNGGERKKGDESERGAINIPFLDAFCVTEV